MDDWTEADRTPKNYSMIPLTHPVVSISSSLSLSFLSPLFPLPPYRPMPSIKQQRSLCIYIYIYVHTCTCRPTCVCVSVGVFVCVCVFRCVCVCLTGHYLSACTTLFLSLSLSLSRLLSVCLYFHLC